MTKDNWTRDELILAFNLYCKTPFGRIHLRNPDIIRLAKAIGRTPSSVSWKLANFARLDPSLKSRNISGATHGAKGEKEIWAEFSGNWDNLAYESERLASQMIPGSVNLDALPEGIDRPTLVQVRVNQGFFRSAVLAAYDLKCCITDLSVPQFLTASHIVPWAKDTCNRTDPRNGLCLNALHDRAFDCGLITVTPEYIVKVSPALECGASDKFGNATIRAFDGKPIRLPRRFQPARSFLKYHNEHVYVKS